MTRWLPSVVLFATLCRADEPKPAEVEWLRTHAIPLKTCEPGTGFDDLAPLKALIGNDRIVALGEGTHGTREFFQMKHRLLEFLASEMGFTIFSIEACMPESYRLNDYVLKGAGDPRELIAGMYFWTWDTQEVFDMVQWMREFNRSGRGRIEFTGFDMQTPDVAMDIVVDFLMKVDAEAAPPVRKTYDELKRANRDGGGGGGFGVATATFPVEAARGKKVRFSGRVRTDGVTPGYAGLWWRCDGPSGVLAFDNMHDRGAKGDSDWKEYEIALDVPAETTNINFGMLLIGGGRAWFDGLAVVLDGQRFEPGDTLDFDFEGERPRGYFTGGRGYEVVTDATRPASGQRCLRMARTAAGDAAADSSTLSPAKASDRARAIVKQMEAARDAYVKAAGAREADWAIQNARVVQQCMDLAAERAPRDKSMAQNVRWILDQAPPGTKIVLWAHNGHLNRGRQGMESPMGRHLARTFKDDLFVIGFAAGEGDYTAMNGGRLSRTNKLAPPEPGSFEDYCRRTGLPCLLIDTRLATAAETDSAWLTRPLPMRSIGALAMDSQFHRLEVPPAYDAVIYVDETTASRAIAK